MRIWRRPAIAATILVGACQSASGPAGLGRGPNDVGADASAPEATQRIELSFNNDWKYLEGDASGPDGAVFTDSSWAYVDLPHSTRFVTPDSPNAYVGVSWYRKHFQVPSDYQGRKVYLTFEAAMQAADVWVNGVKLTRHEGGYTPFSIDLTQAVSYGGADNVIAVRVDSSASPSWGPGWSGVDFQFHGGLYRSARLTITNPLHVTDAVYANQVASGGVFVTTVAADATAATVNVKTHVINESLTAKEAAVTSELVDADGQIVGSDVATANIGAGAEFAFAQNITISNPRLWHPDTPALYTLRTTLRDGKTPVDDMATRTGIRRIAWSHDGLFINGTRFKALGTNMHQEMYGLGNAVPDRSIYLDLKRIREAGMTFVRGAHYPHAPAFYDACDELGILVLDAQTGWQQFIDEPTFKEHTYQELRDMIRRDRNHASVVAWEASLNESNFSDEWAAKAHAIVHEEYPGDQAYSAAWLLSHADIFIDASQHGVRNSGDPRPIIINEYGDWDYGGAASTSRQQREAGDAAMLTAANNVEDGTTRNLGVSWFSAGSYWDYADYGGFSNYGITRCGLVDMYRLPKFAYYFLQSQRDPNLLMSGLDLGPMVYIANHWAASSPTTVRVYGNCEEVALSLNDTLVETRSPDPGTNLSHPPFNFVLGAFTPGVLRADCRIGGISVTSFTRQTPGAAAALALRPEATTLRADSSDARLVFIDVLDANGTVVPADASTVTLTVSGPGTLVGPASLDMKGGQLATWVRGTRTSGRISVSASAPGLVSGSVDLTSEAVSGLPPAPADRSD